MDVDAGRNLRTKPRRRTARGIVKTRHAVRVSRATRGANAQEQARRDQHAKNRRAWDVGSRNAADSATLARASETTRVASPPQHARDVLVLRLPRQRRVHGRAPFQTQRAPGVHAAAWHRRAHVAATTCAFAGIARLSCSREASPLHCINVYQTRCRRHSRRWAARSPPSWRLQVPPRPDRADGSNELVCALRQTDHHARGGDLPHGCNAYLRFKN